MMEAAFAAADLPWSYISIPVSMGSFTDAFEATRQLGFAGLHITVVDGSALTIFEDAIFDGAKRRPGCARAI